MDKKLHDIDALFTENLEGETAQPSGHVWPAIEAGLNQRDLKTMRSKNKRLKWLAALLVILLTTSLVWLYQTRTKQDNTAAAKTTTTTLPTDINNPAPELPADTKSTATASDKQSNQPATDNDNNSSNDITPAPLTQQNSQPTDKQGSKAQADQPIHQPESNATDIISKPTKPSSPINTQAALLVKRPKANNKTNQPPQPTLQPDRGDVPNPATPSANNLQVNKPLAAGQKRPSKMAKRLQTTITPANATAGDETIASANDRAVNYELPPAEKGLIETLGRPSVLPLMNLKTTHAPKLSQQLPKQRNSNQLSFSIAPYYALNWFTAKVNNGRPQHREDNRNDIKQREQPSNHSSEASFGLLVTASFNKKWAVQTGVGLVNINNDINSHTLYARKDSMRGGGGPPPQAGFKFNCTAGTVYFSSKLINTNPNVGDSLDLLQSSSRLQYLQVPLSLRYTFISKGALQLYGITGATANLLTRGQVNATISNGSIKENVSANTINGLNKLYWGLHLGAGLEYKTGKRLGVYLSPTYSFGITPINKETPVSTRLRQFSVMGGLRLRLGK